MLRPSRKRRKLHLVNKQRTTKKAAKLFRQTPIQPPPRQPLPQAADANPEQPAPSPGYRNQRDLNRTLGSLGQTEED